MKAAHLRKLDYHSLLGRLHGAGFWCVFVQRQVSSGPVIIADIPPHNLPEVLFSEDHDVIETFAPNCPDYSLRKGILPRTLRCGDDFLDGEGPDSLAKGQAVHSIPISRIMKRGESMPQNASTICCDVHSAVGCSVTLKCTILRRSCASTMRTNRTRNVAVGTVKKSIETSSLIWLSRNALHDCEGGCGLLGIKRETVLSEMLIPSFRSSPCTRGAPHNGFAPTILRINSRIPRSFPGRPEWPRPERRLQ